MACILVRKYKVSQILVERENNQRTNHSTHGRVMIENEGSVQRFDHCLGVLLAYRAIPDRFHGG